MAAAALSLLLQLGLLALALHAGRSLKSLSRLRFPAPKRHPRVAIVLAARNEERELRRALTSVLSLTYPAKEVWVVDDRSTDATPGILAELTREYPELRALRVESLPPGWLGKNHALFRAARASSGDWLLFTDADVVFHPECLERFVGYAESARLDHLTALPFVWSRSPFCNAFITYFGKSFMTYFLPWKVSDPKSKAYVGIGAFNLVRRSAYEAVGGHERIRLRADDDVKLGKILKHGGFRCDVLEASAALSVEWHRRLVDCVRGLEKSILPGWDYRLSRVFLGMAGILVTDLAPFLLLFFTEGTALGLAAAASAAALFTGAYAARGAGHRFHRGLWLPLCALVMEWVVIRSALLPWLRGGIIWRGTFYPLDELRSNRV